jgi:hypothetical protein
MNKPGRLLRAALRYAGIGWPVFPLNEYGIGFDCKAPHRALGKEGGHHSATTDAVWITNFWGQHPNANIGIYLKAAGLIAVDIDPKNDGFVKLKELERDHGPITSKCVQITGSDGAHRLFVAPVGLRAPPGKVLNTKGLDLKWNGYIVAAPSIHPNGKRYHWQTGGSPFDGHPLPELPAWALVRGASNSSAVTTGVADPDEIGGFVTKCHVTIEEMAATLALIPNIDEDYDDWLKVCQGCWHESDGSEGGRLLALEWSEKSPKHVRSEYDKTWASCDHAGKHNPVTFRFVLGLAKPFRQAKQQAVMSDLDGFLGSAATVAELMAKAEEISEMDLDHIDRSRAAIGFQVHYLRITGEKVSRPDAKQAVRHKPSKDTNVPAWLAHFAHLELPDTYFRSTTGQELPPAEFDRLNNRHLLTPKQKAEGKTMPANRPSDVAITRYMIPQVHNKMYLPNAPLLFTKDGIPYVNSFRPSTLPGRRVGHTPRAEEVEAIRVVEDHFRFLIPDDRERGLLLSWLSYVLRTKSRPSWGIIVHGPEGVGKSFIGQLMMAALGEPNVIKITPATLEDKFNGWAEGHLLVIVEELKLQGHNRFDVINKIKPLLTDRNIPIRRMHVDTYNVVNTSSYLMFTNFRDALPISDNDSRYFMASTQLKTYDEVKAHVEANPGYYSTLFVALEDHSDALRDWLYDQQPVAEFNPNSRAPWSATHEQAAEEGLSDEHQDLRDAWQGEATPSQTGLLFDVTEWQFERATSGLPTLNGVSVASLMAAEGFQRLCRVKLDDVYHIFYSRQPLRWPTSDTALRAQIRFIAT